MVSTAVCPCFIGIWIHFQLGWDSDSLFGGNCAACLPKLCSCFVFHLGSSISLKLVFRNPVCNLEGGGGEGILSFIKITSRTFVEEKAWRKGRSQWAINENIGFLAECRFPCKANTKKGKKWFLGFWFLWPFELICSREKGANIFVLFGREKITL